MARLFYGWVVVGGAFLVLFTAYGAQHCFGVFFPALLDEFGWSRASLAGAFSLYASAYCVFGFPAGRLTDRWGPRTVIALGGLFLGAALVGMGFVRSLWQPYVLYGLVAALGMGTAYVPCNATVVKWFVRRRGLAVGVASSGAGVGTFLLPPLAQVLVTSIGWRAAYVVLGVVVLLVLNAVALVMRRDPESAGFHPDGEAAPAAAGIAEPPGWPLGRAARTAAFWLLAGAYSASWLPVFIPLVHLVRFARDLGFSPLVAASVMSAVGIGAVGGRLVMGPLSDRLGRRLTIAVSMALQALAFLGFLVVASLPALYVAAFAFGYSSGAVTSLFPAMAGDLFGREQAGTIVGVIFAIAGGLGGWGPLVAGAIHDARGSYALAWLSAAAFNAAGAVLVSLCRPPAAAGAARLRARAPAPA